MFGAWVLTFYVPSGVFPCDFFMHFKLKYSCIIFTHSFPLSSPSKIPSPENSYHVCPILKLRASSLIITATHTHTQFLYLFLSECAIFHWLVEDSPRCGALLGTNASCSPFSTTASSSTDLIVAYSAHPSHAKITQYLILPHVFLTWVSGFHHLLGRSNQYFLECSQLIWHPKDKRTNAHSMFTPTPHLKHCLFSWLHPCLL